MFSILGAAAAIAAAAVAVAEYLKKKGEAFTETLDYEPDDFLDEEQIIIEDTDEEETETDESGSEEETKENVDESLSSLSDEIKE